MLPTKFRYIWPNSFRGEEFLKSANQKQDSPVVAMATKNGQLRDTDNIGDTGRRQAKQKPQHNTEN